MYTKPPILTADRSLPRKSVVMMMYPDEMKKVEEPILPEGYSFRLYQHGDEESWARIAVSVEEYLTIEEGKNSLKRFIEEDEEELKRRLVFVIAPDGTAVATSMAWFFEEEGRRFGRVHWIMNNPLHQGRGLGRAIVAWAVRRLTEFEPGLITYLDTQTWSHKAIGLYLRMGFHPCRDGHPILNTVNEYTDALEVLRKDVLPMEVLEMFVQNSVD